jgi:hypothetical protein
MEAFKDLPSSPDEVEHFTKLLREEIALGEVDPLKMKIFLKGLERVIEGVKDLLDPLARDEAEKYSSKEFEVLGWKVALREVGQKYNYDNCGHPVYARLKEEVKPKLDEIKSIEKTLQTLKGNTIITDPETGETCEVFPPVKSSTSSIVISK